MGRKKKEQKTGYTVDYRQWKVKVKKELNEKIPKHIVKKFIGFLSSRYDQYDRHFLNYRVALTCWNLHNKVVRYNQHQVYGFFGRGGSGKSTLAKNVLYFHDPTFNQSRIATDMFGFVKIIRDLMKMGDDGKFKSFLLDEVEIAQHVQSKEWRIAEDLLQQIRKRNWIIGICSTRLGNVKGGLYDLVTGIFAFRDLFIFDYYDEERRPGICASIRKAYQDKKNLCFTLKEIMRYRSLNNIGGHKFTPIDQEQKKYEEEKDKVFAEKVNAFLKMYEPKKEKSKDVKEKLSETDSLVMKWKEQGLKNAQIGKLLGVSGQAVCMRLVNIRKRGIHLVSEPKLKENVTKMFSNLNNSPLEKKSESN